ncbi:helix-turn-helix domain-containing protein [Oscillibacter sp. MSJ-2]|uniref:Helix-turn-helix domain-containing protein n=1 Tax=Dysosmobacter acutus TaxID=2841504 RepID=A0ABS6F7D5_9FIRM|nr:helix-turn-helix domain-containing protein [Dysosmobacter acutus]
MDIGTRIRELRLERGLSQEALAEQLKVSRQAVTKWESGASVPSTARLLALCEVFGLSPVELAGPGTAEKKDQPWKRAALAAASLVLILATAAAIAANWGSPLPDNTIGYADGPTGIGVYGLPLWVYGLCAVTAITLAASVISLCRSFFRKRRRET